MMLVPYVEQKGGALRPLISQPTWEFHVGKPPKIYPENALDVDMETILQNKKTGTGEKYRQYMDVLQRQRIKNYKKEHPQIKYNRKKASEPMIRNMKEKLINNVPRWKRDKAKQLYDFIVQIPQLSINEYDEIEINGERIENSNITQLFVDMSSDVYRNESLPGQTQFMDLLIRNGISSDVIGNEAYQREVNENISPVAVAQEIWKGGRPLNWRTPSRENSDSSSLQEFTNSTPSSRSTANYESMRTSQGSWPTSSYREGINNTTTSSSSLKMSRKPPKSGPKSVSKIASRSKRGNESDYIRTTPRLPQHRGPIQTPGARTQQKGQSSRVLSQRIRAMGVSRNWQSILFPASNVIKKKKKTDKI